MDNGLNNKNLIGKLPYRKNFSTFGENPIGWWTLEGIQGI